MKNLVFPSILVHCVPSALHQGYIQPLVYHSTIL